MKQLHNAQRICKVSDVLRWMSQRQLKRTRGVWIVAMDQLQRCMTHPATRPILEHMEQLHLQYGRCALDWNQFATYRIKHLRLDRIDTTGVSAVTLSQPILPLLENVCVSYCRLSIHLLTALSKCERLLDVEYSFVEELHLSYEEQQALWPYFQRMRAFRFTGDISGLLSSHLPRRRMARPHCT